MAKPRIFVSSTYYDLKHLRSSLENFIESLGYEPILSEKGDISFTPDAPPDESCYREVLNADIYILIIGGRYGTEVSDQQKKPTHDFFERYESITKQEYTNALERDISTYILIENNVYSEYQTFLKNRENRNIVYAHVDSVNIFHFIEHILTQQKNNPIHTFERFSEIEAWLKEQWAGLFREFLHRRSDQQQIATLSSQVDNLNEINKTLKRYLEAVVSKIDPEDAAIFIQKEDSRLKEAIQLNKLKRLPIIRFLTMEFNLIFETICDIISSSSKYSDFVQNITLLPLDGGDVQSLNMLFNKDDAKKEINEAREILGLSLFPILRRRRKPPVQ